MPNYLEPSKCPLCFQPLLKVHLIFTIIEDWRLIEHLWSNGALLFYLFICLSIYLFIWLHWVLVVARGISFASCRSFIAGQWLSNCGTWVQLLQHVGLVSLSQVWDLNSLTENQIPICTLQGRFLTTGLPGNPSFIFLIFYLYLIILGLIKLKIVHVNISPIQDRYLRQRGIHTSFPSAYFSWKDLHLVHQAWSPCSAELLSLS